MTKLALLVFFSLFYNVQLSVTTKERVSNETVQDVSLAVAPQFHQGRGSDSQEKPELEPDARWNPPLNALP